MCLFPFANNKPNSIAYKKGLIEFKCGGCPECLGERARSWALRCSMHAKNHIGCMITLTYDQYIHDNRGNVIGERVSELEVNKKDCQKFIKRVRRYFEYHYNIKNIKYLITAEYGSRTHRAHYHCILFGVSFEDIVYYKKSKRGNIIYKSQTLTDLWGLGICTVDSININSAVARYCTKYCAKDARSENTFMLVSRGIGIDNLMQEFNGRSYIIDGREYPIPKQVWQLYIENKYNIPGYSKYISVPQAIAKNDKIQYNLVQRINSLREYADSLCNVLRGSYAPSSLLDLTRLTLAPIIAVELYDIRKYIRMYIIALFLVRSDVMAYSRCYSRNLERRRTYYYLRDNDTVYKRYLCYWSNKVAAIELTRLPILDRINLLPDSKYFAYKQAALKCYFDRQRSFKLFGDSDRAIPPPRSGCVSRYYRYWDNIRYHLPITPSCHKSANDTRYHRYYVTRNKNVVFLAPTNVESPPIQCDLEFNSFMRENFGASY